MDLFNIIDKAKETGLKLQSKNNSVSSEPIRFCCFTTDSNHKMYLKPEICSITF